MPPKSAAIAISRSAGSKPGEEPVVAVVAWQVPPEHVRPTPQSLLLVHALPDAHKLLVLPQNNPQPLLPHKVFPVQSDAQKLVVLLVAEPPVLVAVA